MPLGTREILFILRAKDEVSRTLGEIGRGFGNLDGAAQQAAQQQMATGKALMGVGAAGIAFFNSAIGAAREFNKEAALTLTQVDQVGVTLEDLKTVAKNVAKDIPAPFEQLQSSLFDIFSSMDVNLQQSQALLTAFARAAVAGNTDVQTAGRATIAIMNGFGLSTDQVSRVMDVQFQLVRKGVGTYDEFASAIGRAIPSAARAGQQVETLAGMMAFLTRNGLTAAMAATSSARALDSFSNPIVVGRLEEMGVKVRGIHGEFLPLVDIIGQLHQKWEGLAAPELAEKVQTLFKGAGGTIQARRFIDPALRLFDEFKQRVGEMQDSSGSMDKAYDIMFKQPQNQIQLLKNNLMILKTEIGDALAPSVGKLVQAGLALVKWFNDLSPGVKQTIVYIAAASAVFMTLAGIIIFMAGLFLTLSAASAMAGISIGAVVWPILLVVAAVIALIAIVVLIIKHWATLKEWALIAWNAIKDAAQGAIDFIAPYWNAFWEAMKSTAQAAWMVLQKIWDALVWVFQGILIPALNTFIAIWNAVWNLAVGAIMLAWKGIKNVAGYIAGFFTSVLMPAISVFGQFWVSLWQIVSGTLEAAWGLMQPIFQFIIDTIGKYVPEVLSAMAGAFSSVFSLIGAALSVLWTSILQPIFSTIGTIITDYVIPIVWNLMKAYITVWEAIGKVVFWFAEKIWWPVVMAIVGYVQDILIPAVKLIAEIFGVAFGVIVAALKLWFEVAQAVFMTFVSILQAILMPVIWLLKETFERIFSAIGFVVKLWWDDYVKPIFNVFDWSIRNLLLPAINLLSSVWSAIWGAFGTVLSAAWNGVIKPVWNAIKGFIDNTLIPAFQWLADKWGSLWSGMSSVAKSIWDGITGIIVTAVNGVLGIVEGFVNGIIDGVNTGIHAINKLPGPDLIHEIDKVTLPRIAQATAARQQVAQAFAPAGGGPVKAMQLGGTAYANMPHWVGENGRELFVPQTTGTILPEGKVGGVTIAEGAVSITIQGNVDSSLIPVIRSEIEGAIRRVVQELAVR